VLFQTVIQINPFKNRPSFKALEG